VAQTRPMVKGGDRCQDSLGTSPILEREKSELFKKRLLQKREGWHKHFSNSLSKIDAALLRVAVNRSMIVERSIPLKSVEGPLVELSKRRATVVLVEKTPIRELGRKEKENIKKYAAKVRDRRRAVARRFNAKEDKKTVADAVRAGHRYSGVPKRLRKQLEAAAPPLPPVHAAAPTGMSFGRNPYVQYAPPQTFFNQGRSRGWYNWNEVNAVHSQNVAAARYDRAPAPGYVAEDYGEDLEYLRRKRR